MGERHRCAICGEAGSRRQATEEWQLEHVRQSPASLTPPIGEDRAELTVELETEEPTNFFGKVIEKTQVPQIYHRDTVRSLGNLEEIATVGLPT